MSCFNFFKKFFKKGATATAATAVKKIIKPKTINELLLDKLDGKEEIADILSEYNNQWLKIIEYIPHDAKTKKATLKDNGVLKRVISKVELSETFLYAHKYLFKSYSRTAMILRNHKLSLEFIKRLVDERIIYLYDLHSYKYFDEETLEFVRQYGDDDVPEYVYDNDKKVVYEGYDTVEFLLMYHWKKISVEYIKKCNICWYRLTEMMGYHNDLVRNENNQLDFEGLVEKFQDHYNWDSITSYEYFLSEEFLLTHGHRDKVLYELTDLQNYSMKVIETFPDKVDWSKLNINKYPEEFQLKWAKNFGIEEDSDDEESS